jgi:hypothetical protein
MVAFLSESFPFGKATMLPLYLVPGALPLGVLRASKDVRCKPRLVLQKLHSVPEIGILSAWG